MPNRVGLIRLRSFNSSRWWATVYLLFIPLFAAIYFGLPAHSFYHQTSQFEHGVAQDQDKAEDAIAKSMLAEVAKHELPEGWTIAAIHVRNLTPVPSGDDFSFSARFNLQRRYGTVDRNKGASMSVATASVDVIAQNETLSETTMSTPDGRQAYVVTTPAAFAPDGIVPANLFPFGYDAKTKILRMPIARDAKVEINLYLDGMHGFPHEFSWEHFWRMLYFSAITVTTLGYGDISPLTGPARFFTAAEAILGIVVIGLFLNALAREASRSSRR